MNLNKVLEAFYKAMLSYAGVGVAEDGHLYQSESKVKNPIQSESGKIYHLPYFELLNNPDGKTFFHPLHENFQRKASEAHHIFRHHLLESINTKLLLIMSTLIEIGSDVNVQKLIKDIELADLITKVGEVTDDQIDVLSKVFVKAVETENDPGCLVSFFLKEDGKIKDDFYRVYGKVNFTFYKEVTKALEEQSGSYTLHGVKVRKKDLITFKAIMLAIFPDLEDISNYEVGTDNGLFGYLNCLLLVSYRVAFRMNEILDLINKDIGTQSEEGDIRCDLSWSELLEDVYNLTDEIKAIPIQLDVKVESKRKSNALTVDESKVKGVTGTAPQPQAQVSNQPPKFTPPTQPVKQPAEKVYQPPADAVSVEQLLTNGAFAPQPQMNPMMGMYPQMNPMLQQQVNPNMMQPQMNPMMGMQQQNPMMQAQMGMQQGNVPPWLVQMEMEKQMREQQQMNPQQNQPNMMQPQMGMFPQGNMMQPQMNPMMGMQQPQMHPQMGMQQQNPMMNQQQRMMMNQQGMIGGFDPFAVINPNGM